MTTLADIIPIRQLYLGSRVGERGLIRSGAVVQSISAGQESVICSENLSKDAPYLDVYVRAAKVEASDLIDAKLALQEATRHGR